MTATVMEPMPYPLRLVQTIGRVLSSSGVTTSPEVYPVAGRVAVALVSRSSRDSPTRMLTLLSERLFGVVSPVEVDLIRKALAHLDLGTFLASRPPDSVRVVAHFGRTMHPQARATLVDRLLQAGMYDDYGVACRIEQVADPTAPYVVADVPKRVDPGLPASKAGDRGRLPRIEKDWIVGINGFPRGCFERLWSAGRH